ncbi:MAG: hypothetical protein OEV85_06660 [Candidatus Thorarchaeota archaeon]|nr:hypothetical protein [Candidatus Thorarchaeota archaeon]
MNGRDMLLILAHLFRMKGSPVSVVDAVDFLSFKCRYGAPSDVRKMLTMALNNEMISKDDNGILAEFLYDKQILPLNLSWTLEDRIRFRDNIEPIS